MPLSLSSLSGQDAPCGIKENPEGSGDTACTYNAGHDGPHSWEQDAPTEA